MVSVLAVREVVVGKIGSRMWLVCGQLVLLCASSIPRHDDLVVDTVKLHMLESPSFIDTFRYYGFSEPSQVRCMVHAHFDSIRSKFLNQ